MGSLGLSSIRAADQLTCSIISVLRPSEGGHRGSVVICDDVRVGEQRRPTFDRYLKIMHRLNGINKLFEH